MVPTFTFYASASTAVFAGLRPVFVDADAATFNLDIDALEPLVTERTSAIMPVHVYGHSPPLDRIVEFAARHDLAVIEDAAQAYGVAYRGRHAGTWGDVGVISFFADKTITMGEGGVVLTNDAALHLQPTLQQYAQEALPVAEELYKKGICLPVHQGLTSSDIDDMSEIISKVHSGL